MFTVVHGKGGNADQLSQLQEASSQEAHVECDSSLIEHTHKVGNSFHLLHVYVCQALPFSVYLLCYLIFTVIRINFMFYKQGNGLRGRLSNLAHVKLIYDAKPGFEPRISDTITRVLSTAM